MLPSHPAVMVSQNILGVQEDEEFLRRHPYLVLQVGCLFYSKPSPSLLSIRNRQPARLIRGEAWCVMGGDEAKTWFDDVLKYRVRDPKGQSQYLVVQAFCRKAVLSAILVELLKA
jgi:hypothetical protein